MREVIQHAKTEDLNMLLETIADCETVTEERADLFSAVVDELTKRGALQKTPEDEIQAFLEDTKRKAVAAQADTRLPAEEEHPLLKHIPQILEDARRDRAEQRQRRMALLRLPIAAASMIVILLLSNAVAVAAGYDFLGSMSRWTKDAVSFVFGTDSLDEPTGDVTREYDGLKMILNNLDIHVDLPKHMLDGFRFDSIEPEKPDGSSNIVAWYVYLDDYFSISIKRIAGASSERFSESDGEEYSEIYTKGDNQFMVTTNNNRVKAIWYQGIYELKIQGSISYEQLTQILDSI